MVDSIKERGGQDNRQTSRFLSETRMSFGDVYRTDKMDSRQPSSNATTSPTRSSQATPRDALCKVAFVDVDVAKATPRTSCRSAASSDSDESVTSSVTSSMTSSSRDDDDDDEMLAPATWTTYAYFYPRHDMTYTHCLLSTSRHVDCDRLTSTSARWPALPGQHDVLLHKAETR